MEGVKVRRIALGSAGPSFLKGWVVCWTLLTFVMFVGCDPPGGGSDTTPPLTKKRPQPESSSPQTTTVGRTVAPLVNLPPHSSGQLWIASYNIQVLGTSKIQKPDVVEVLAQTLRRFHLVAIQELRAKDQTVVDRLVAAVNANGRRFQAVVGPRLGRTNSKEQYVFLYDTQVVQLVPGSVFTVRDPGDKLHREPLVARFQATRSNGQPLGLTLINVHTDPDIAEQEVGVLLDVFTNVEEYVGPNEDVLMLGDFNLSAKKLATFRQSTRLSWTVNNQPTNTLRTKSYDNIIFDPRATTEFDGVAGIFDVQKEFRLSKAAALKVSDHNPVWIALSLGAARAQVANSRNQTIR